MNTPNNAKRLGMGLATVFILAAAPAAWPAEAMVTLPSDPVAKGDMFDIPVYVSDGAEDLASYSLRLNYAPDILNVVEIAGGVSAPFAAAPVTNPAGFASGKTDFTAVNDGFVTTPTMFEVARIRLQAVGRPGDVSPVSLSLTPNGGLVDSVEFALLDTTFAGGGDVTIVDDGTAGTLPPNAPANVQARAKGQRVSVGWVGAADADLFRVFRLLVGEDDYSEIGQTVNRAYTDVVPSGPNWASYYIVAENVFGASGASNSAAVTIESQRRGRR